MSRHHQSATAGEEVRRLLEPLAGAEVEIPSADVVYWRAQARLTIDAASRRRTTALRPLRVFHRAVGGGAIAMGALTSLWPLVLPPSAGAGLLAVTILVAMVTAGAYLLAEIDPAA